MTDIEAVEHCIKPLRSDKVSSEKVLVCNDSAEWVALPVTARQQGWYNLSVRCGSNNGTSTINLYVNGIIVATRTAASPLGNTPSITVLLKSGLNVVRYQELSGTSYLQSIMFTPSDTVVSVKPPQAVAVKAQMIIVKSASGAIVGRVIKPSGVENEYAVYDIQGKYLALGKIDGRVKCLVLPRLANGIYFLRANNKNSRISHDIRKVARIIIK